MAFLLDGFEVEVTGESKSTGIPDTVTMMPNK